MSSVKTSTKSTLFLAKLPELNNFRLGSNSTIGLLALALESNTGSILRRRALVSITDE